MSSEKLHDLCAIMGAVHALVDSAWPRDDVGVSAMPESALRLIIDIQTAAAAALGLPEDTPLMTGNPEIDID